jgi:hypothetical protein
MALEVLETLRSPWMVASMGLPEGSIPFMYMASPRRIASSTESPAGGAGALSAAVTDEANIKIRIIIPMIRSCI